MKTKTGDKKEPRKTLASYGHDKAARMAEAKKTGKSEMELYLFYCKKYGIEPAPCAIRWQKKMEKREAEKAADKKAA